MTFLGPPLYGPHQRQLAWTTTGCFLRLEGVPRQWRVERACSFEQMVSGSRVDSRPGVVCACLRWWTAASVALFPWFPSLSAGIVVVLRLCDSSERGAQVSTDLRPRPVRMV
eukprot:scaffold10239_cov122-Isochrysis_galbana.AAC.9